MSVNKISDDEALERFKELGFQNANHGWFNRRERRSVNIAHNNISWRLKRPSGAVTDIRINNNLWPGSIKTIIDAANCVFDAVKFVSDKSTVKARLYLASRHNWSVMVSCLGREDKLTTDPSLIHLLADKARGENVNGIIWDLLQDLELA